MTAISVRRRLFLLGLTVALAGFVGLLARFRPHTSPASGTTWSEVGAQDPRVAGVFTTLQERGLSAALDSLERKAAADSLVLRAGHQLAHALGRHAFSAMPGGLGVIAQCRAVFASGCYHGVVEAALAVRDRIDVAELEGMCAAAGNAGSLRAVYECMHGLGHGLLAAVELDVPKALQYCDSLSSPRFSTACHQGAFMEAITLGLAGSGGHHHAHHGAIAIDPADPYSPCRGFDDPYADSCWLFQGFVILRSVGFDPGRALRVCDGAPGGRAGRCYESVGHQLAGLFQRGNDWIIAQCASGRAELAPHCSAGAALALAALDWSGKRVREFCAGLPEAWRDACRLCTPAASLDAPSVPVAHMDYGLI